MFPVQPISQSTGGRENGVLMSDKKTNQQQNIPAVILICFFLSGLLGLTYEIIWIRKLGLIFGTTVVAMTTVLAAFFGGLAAGSYIFGRISDRLKNPIQAYAVLELLISIFAFFFPVILILAGKFYSLFYPYLSENFIVLNVTRFILFAALLVLPTTMMGATLPLVSRFFIRSPEYAGGRFGILYAVNTFGAVAGAFFCGFYCIRTLGVDTSNHFAAILNAVVALTAYWQSRQLILPAETASLSEPPPKDDGGKVNGARKSPFFIPVCFFLSGFASIGYEIIWTRYVSLPLSNTRYTYTIILTVFLLGTAIGSILFASFFDKVKNKIRFFGCLEIGIGISAFLLVPLVYLAGAKVQYSLFAFEFLICAVLMLIPTVLMGAAFPIVIKIMTASSGRIGCSTGTCYAVNTLGCISGALVTGFLLIPFLGIRLSLNVIVAVNLLAGFYCLLKDAMNVNKKWIFNAIIAVVSIGAVLLIHASIHVRIPEDFLTTLKNPAENITLTRECLENTVWETVNPSNQQHSLWVNRTVLGRTLAMEPYRVPPQIIAGHIPMLLHHGDLKKVLGICLGTGQTFGSILAYDIDTMDIVELSKTIIGLACTDFKDVNRDLGNNARVHLIAEDGRNFVAHTKNNYDVITLEPPPPEEAGIVNLYSAEFYQLCGKRLNKNGILSQWLPIHSTSPDDTKRIIKTFVSVFPNSVLWYNTADLILLGFNGGIAIDAEKMQALLSNPGIAKDLSVSYIGSNLPDMLPAPGADFSADSAGNTNLTGIKNFLACLLMGPAELQRFSLAAVPVTDNHPDLEYTFAKYDMLKNRQEWLVIWNADSIRKNLAPLKYYLPPMSRAEVEKIEKIRSRYIAQLYADVYLRLATGKAVTGLEESIALCKKALDYNPEYGLAYYKLGDNYFEQGNQREAIGAYEKAVYYMPMVIDIWQKLITAYKAAGRLEEAERTLQRAMDVQQKYSSSIYNK